MKNKDITEYDNNEFDVNLSNKNIFDKWKQLDYIKQDAINDSQINTSGKFYEFTDIQNVMMSDISLLELLFEMDNVSFNGKTIGELYVDSLSLDSVIDIEYDKLQFDGYTMIEMSKKENWNKYRYQVFGKLVRYGFAELKINDIIRGKHGFGAIVLEDVDGNVMVYFPCTNLTVLDDFVYDSYPIIASLPIMTDIVNKVPNKARKVYNSQQEQARTLLDECIKNVKPGTKVYVSGFSLGGSLAENAYLNSYKDNTDVLGGIILFNPYHDRLSEEEINVLKENNNLKLYVCEGDVVSTVFNYDGLVDVAKTIYIDYEKSAAEMFDNIDNDQGMFNLVINNIKDQFCDDIMTKCKLAKKKNNMFNYPFNSLLRKTYNTVKKVKELNLNALSTLKSIDNVVEMAYPVLKKVGVDLKEKYDLSFLENIQYMEFLFTCTHLTYTIDPFKNVSFDEKGSVKKSIIIDNKLHEITYPSFNDSMVKFLGSDPFGEVSNILGDTKEATKKINIFSSIKNRFIYKKNKDD